MPSLTKKRVANAPLPVFSRVFPQLLTMLNELATQATNIHNAWLNPLSANKLSLIGRWSFFSINHTELLKENIHNLCDSIDDRKNPQAAKQFGQLLLYQQEPAVVGTPQFSLLYRLAKILFTEVTALKSLAEQEKSTIDPAVTQRLSDMIEKLQPLIEMTTRQKARQKR